MKISLLRLLACPTWPLLLTMLVTLTWPDRLRADDFSGDVELFLYGAVSHEPADPGEARNLMIFASAREGNWARVWGKAQEFGVGDHYGLVDEARITDERVEMTVSLLVMGDFWARGEWPAVFHVRAERDADGRLEGRFEGHFNGHRMEGRVEGRVLPPVDQPGFIEPRPDERPRLLFRASELEQLRERAATPFGKAYLKATEGRTDLISLGMRYQLTGDAKYARQAMEEIERRHRREIPLFVSDSGSGGFGHAVFEVALAFDLCVEAWPERFVSRIREQLEDFVDRHQLQLMTSHPNYHPCSNYYGPGRGVPAIVAIALWGDQGPMPRMPRNPLERPRVIAPMEGFTPGDGVAAARLELGKPMGGRWIWSGRLPLEVSRDVMAGIGGYSRATPKVGTEVTYLAQVNRQFTQGKLKFVEVPADATGESGIELPKLMGEEPSSTSVFFTAIEVAEDVAVSLDRHPEGQRIFISGIELETGGVFRLDAGMHPLLVEVRAEGRARGAIGPVLHSVTGDAQNPTLALYDIKRRLWNHDHAHWKTDGLNPRGRFWVERGWWQNYQHYRLGIGDGGFKAETGVYGRISSWFPSVYAGTAWRFLGRPVSPHPDVSHLIPRQIVQAIFSEPGSAEVIAINSIATLNIVPGANARTGRHWIAALFPTIPPRYQPSVLWVWNHLTGVEGADTLERLFQPADEASGLTLAQTFLHYPLGMKPVHPDEGMPKTWRAETFGLFAARSGYANGEEVLAQVFAKASPIHGWSHPNAGAVHLWGMGHEWTTVRRERNGVRQNYSVVLLPDDQIHQGAGARRTHFESRPDGSMSLTLNMDDVYARRSPGLVDSMFLRDESRRVDSGITGIRAVAVDYSEASGLPAVMVMADSIQGGGRKLWTWQLPPGGEANVASNRLTIRQGEAVMDAIILSEKPLALRTETVDLEIGTARNDFHGTVRRAVAEGGDDFLAIFMLRKADAPKPTVEITGSGLDSVIRIGERRYRFVDNRIVME
ncbi:MAG: hypothetical protein JJU36_13495 [Phycisphaeraceae bacterium]|nr:hypothetical protein [Phycisphaeraceae bacterium]